MSKALFVHPLDWVALAISMATGLTVGAVFLKAAFP